jgi:hypothetical protein
MRSFMTACGISPKFMFRKGIQRGLKEMMPKLKKHELKTLMVGKGVGQRRASDAEVARAVEMSGGAVKRKTAPLKFRM